MLQKKGGVSTTTNYDPVPLVTTINDGFRYPTDILSFQRDKTKVHPTQKPVALAEYFIRTYTNEGDVILDNCMGSGTTALACMNTKRNFIGFELSKEYYDIAVRRIKDNNNSPTLF